MADTVHSYMDSHIHDDKNDLRGDIMADTVHSYMGSHIHDDKNDLRGDIMADTVHSYMDSHIHDDKNGPAKRGLHGRHGSLPHGLSHQ